MYNNINMLKFSQLKFYMFMFALSLYKQNEIVCFVNLILHIMNAISKSQIQSLNNLIGTNIYHASPNYPMYDKIESYDIEKDYVYFNFYDKDYGQQLPLNKLFKFLNYKICLFNYEMHPAGFKIPTNCCSIVDPQNY